MLFSVIYSVDVPRDESVEGFLPRRSLRRHMQLTEGDEQYDYDYLGGEWEHGKHRKLCGLLTRPQFEAFVQDCDLAAEDVETMGSIGAPGLFPEIWCAPAISFQGDSPVSIQSAYVTPIPETPARRDGEWQDRCWERIRRVVIDMYGPQRWEFKYDVTGPAYARACAQARRRMG